MPIMIPVFGVYMSVASLAAIAAKCAAVVVLSPPALAIEIGVGLGVGLKNKNKDRYKDKDKDKGKDQNNDKDNVNGEKKDEKQNEEQSKQKEERSESKDNRPLMEHFNKHDQQLLERFIATDPIVLETMLKSLPKKEKQAVEKVDSYYTNWGESDPLSYLNYTIAMLNSDHQRAKSLIQEPVKKHIMSHSVSDLVEAYFDGLPNLRTYPRFANKSPIQLWESFIITYALPAWASSNLGIINT